MLSFQAAHVTRGTYLNLWPVRKLSVQGAEDAFIHYEASFLVNVSIIII